MSSSPALPASAPAQSPSEPLREGLFPATAQVVRGVYARYAEDNIGLYAGGVALFGITAVPATASAIASVYGLVTRSEKLWEHVAWMTRSLPGDVALFLEGVVTTAVQTAPGSLSFGAVLGVVLALVSAQQAATGVMAGMNQIARRKDTRSFLRRQAVGLGLAVVWVFSTVLALGVLAALPRLLDAGIWGRLEGGLRVLVLVGRWPVTLGLVAAELALVYRYGPCKACLPWRSVWRGAAVGAVLWAIVSVALTLAVGTLVNYGRYGAAGGLLVVLLWANTSALTVFLGALVAIVHAELVKARDGKGEKGREAMSSASNDITRKLGRVAG